MYSIVKRLIRPIFYVCWELLERHSFGRFLEEWRWRRKKHFKEDFNSWFRQSVAEPHRELLAERVLIGRPASVLEFGCYAGQNLHVISGRDANVVLMGVDINREAVEAGRSLFRRESRNSVQLLTVGEQSLSTIKSGSYDVVMTDATLMYFGPSLIAGVLSELIRIARHGLVLSEWHASGKGETAQSHFVFGQWVHDYETLLRSMVPTSQVSVNPYPKECWGDANWWTYGNLIEVKFNPGRQSDSPSAR